MPVRVGQESRDCPIAPTWGRSCRFGWVCERGTRIKSVLTLTRFTPGLKTGILSLYQDSLNSRNTQLINQMTLYQIHWGSVVRGILLSTDPVPEFGEYCKHFVVIPESDRECCFEIITLLDVFLIERSVCVIDSGFNIVLELGADSSPGIR